MYIGIFTLFSLQYIMFCIAFYQMQNMSNTWSLAMCKTFDFILNFAVIMLHFEYDKWILYHVKWT